MVIPTKAKSKWTEKLQARYSESDNTPFVSAPPWIPQVVDAMFAINTNPLRLLNSMLTFCLNSMLSLTSPVAHKQFI